MESPGVAGQAHSRAMRANPFASSLPGDGSWRSWAVPLCLCVSLPPLQQQSLELGPFKARMISSPDPSLITSEDYFQIRSYLKLWMGMNFGGTLNPVQHRSKWKQAGEESHFLQQMPNNKCEVSWTNHICNNNYTDGFGQESPMNADSS